ncbi:hypothetical protein [uncultured Acetobacteroides sp.]|uniref:hypothetical protein n=1 Tax=uncultured Acetobacteroides sp. TaxID=1760811 RepID=UPI0029F49FC8|nr:hypothetical protein [uncultured Acetobacteroides sp.]
MQTEITKDIQTESGENEFQIRLIKSEGVGLLTSKSEKSYLLLDSIDYWYDLIQDKYPTAKKCSCKNIWFNIQLTYVPRFETEDVREIIVKSTCTKCQKQITQYSIDIRYSPTQHLIDEPITFCEKPKLKCKSEWINTYWSFTDVENFLRFTEEALQSHLYIWYWDKEKSLRFFEKLDCKNVSKVAFENKYFIIYIAKEEIAIDRFIAYSDDKAGAVTHEALWRKNELIEMYCPMTNSILNGTNGIYVLRFGVQHIEKGEVKDKSDNFKNYISSIRDYWKSKFTSKRGRNCFDNEQLYNMTLSENGI